MKLSNGNKQSQINKEAIITVILYIIYFIWWYITGFVMGDKDPSQYTYVLGLPLWFILNSFVGPILFIIAVIFTVKCFFVDFDLDSEENKEKDKK